MLVIDYFFKHLCFFADNLKAARKGKRLRNIEEFVEEEDIDKKYVSVDELHRIQGEIDGYVVTIEKINKRFKKGKKPDSNHND